jgi:hypothetical protein
VHVSNKKDGVNDATNWETERSYIGPEEKSKARDCYVNELDSLYTI